MLKIAISVSQLHVWMCFQKCRFPHLCVHVSHADSIKLTYFDDRERKKKQTSYNIKYTGYDESVQRLWRHVFFSAANTLSERVTGIVVKLPVH